ncbi:uncharacterized protein F4553_002484 [Allocatelliglobosispora scoriae]|uniref:Radical SAM core domain-containing protein n=2 Tax=Allocatelliglobosispora scoriae TaxID=643052 RepID=A0A841BN55_9ACTN|nr:uncharacterized protein [Allocatelliglobosispora scoriae]
MYEHADQSWRTKARTMAPHTLATAARRIAEHAARWQLPGVRVVLHGGEPLLVGVAGLRSALTELTTAIAPVTRLQLLMQSNGVLLTEEFCDLLAEFGVRLGISLDGDRRSNDLHRRFANGNSSHAEAVRALELLRRPGYRHVYAGILCTVDIRNDPIAVYEALLEHRPPRIDFLLPHATWDAPPLRPAGEATAYAIWLGRIHTRWLADGQPVRVRMFDSLHSGAVGGPTGSEQIGLGAADLVVVETDGSWEQADSLKTAFDGAPETGMSVFAHAVDEVAALPEITRRQLGLAGLSEECRSCPVVGQCGGGMFAHRYSTARGFDNPSVYCADLKELIVVVNDSVQVAAVATEQPAATALTDLIDQVGSGAGDERAVTYLADSQVAISRALVVAIADQLRGHPYAAEGWELLGDVDRRSPAATAAVLAHPFVRVWAVGILRGSARDGDAGHGYLCAVAAAAAIRARMSAEVPVPVVGGRLHLPGLGTVVLPAGAAVDVADVVSTAEGFTVRHGGTVVRVDHGGESGDPRWLPVRTLVAPGIEVLLEDADPHRDCHKWQPRQRLDVAEAAAWQRSFAEAWEIIEAEAAYQLPGLRAGLRAMVPLEAGPAGELRASTSRHAFGSVGAERAAPDALAVMIVHEFQHGKLGVLLDLCDLFDTASPVKLQVGWRPDPRPIEGVLQGTYAHLAVTRLWRVRAARSGPGREQAAAAFRQYDGWTRAAVDALRSSGALTPVGERFVDHLAEALAAPSS